MTIGSLFSGIGGLEMGLEMCGLGPVVWQCDSDPYARAVLEAHWPGVKRYEDVRQIDERAERPDIICGGFPCQPVSLAGKRKAQQDTRWLWPFFAAVVARVRPRVVFVENVPGLRTAGLRDVLADLARLGFDAEWDCFSAEEVGAPHRRKRLFLVAHAYGERGRVQPGRIGGENGTGAAQPGDDGQTCDVANADGSGQRAGLTEFCAGQPDAEGGGGSQNGVAHPDGSRELQPGGGVGEQRGRLGDGRRSWPAEPDVGRVAHGVPARVDRLRALGNAVVPQVAEHVGRMIMAHSEAAAA